MKLSTALTLLLAPLAAFAKPPKRTPDRELRLDQLPACMRYCIAETKWRLRSPIPKTTGQWCHITAPPQTPDWIDWGRTMDKCKKHQCESSIFWVDTAIWHYDQCLYRRDKEESLAFLNDYRRAYWWPNERQPIRPPHHKNWISDERIGVPQYQIDWEEEYVTKPAAPPIQEPQ
ncbi:hypothetical protein CORC01_02755 [Colletotrichum orchidophilum]|uniref:Uncharacterized protein n=1 Tax=Colletotrichum orchidophilum TaxID=1209926 RepID=A0A1G4BKP9_9PEZI|nr:uncharacterized protein CORC01_02755 [Colletotrichum orchidophilum]OHF01877.1 hypothetical protein CORC01_02755 [Colletotrichum orchidophilum]